MSVDTLTGALYSKVVGRDRLSIMPLTFNRARLVISSAEDLYGYDDGW